MYYDKVKKEFFEDTITAKKESSDPIATVDSVEDFIRVIKKVNGNRIKGNLYRGQRSKDWLITSALTRYLVPDVSIFESLSPEGIEE